MSVMQYWDETRGELVTVTASNPLPVSGGGGSGGVSEDDFNAHAENVANPHKTTKAHVGLSSVDNVKQATKAEFDTFVALRTNPHVVTKAQVGLSKVADVLQASKAEFDVLKTSMQAEINTLKTNQTSILARLTALETPGGG